MAVKKTVAVTAKNLVRLGADRVAAILLELGGEHPTVKRRLRIDQHDRVVSSEIIDRCDLCRLIELVMCLACDLLGTSSGTRFMSTCAPA